MAQKDNKAAGTAQAATDKDTKTPRERFTSVGVNRVNNVIKAYEILENCADRTNYEYNAQEFAKLKAAIEASHAKTMKRFQDALDGKTAVKVKEGFSL